MTTVVEKLLRCRICGFTGPNVSPGIWKSTAGKYHVINRCKDHLSCSARKLELDRR